MSKFNKRRVFLIIYIFHQVKDSSLPFFTWHNHKIVLKIFLHLQGSHQPKHSSQPWTRHLPNGQHGVWPNTLDGQTALALDTHSHRQIDWRITVLASEFLLGWREQKGANGDKPQSLFVLEARALEFEDMTATTNMVVSAELRESDNNISLTFRTTLRGRS